MAKEDAEASEGIVDLKLPPGSKLGREKTRNIHRIKWYDLIALQYRNRCFNKKNDKSASFSN